MTPSVAESAERERFLVLLGRALVLAGESVDEVQRRLLAVARAIGVPRIEVVVLPTMLLIQTSISAVSRVHLGTIRGSALRLDQISALYALVERAEKGEVTAGAGLIELGSVTFRRPLYRPAIRTVGLGVLSAGFALLLQPTPWGVVIAFVLGIGVGLVRLIRMPEIQAVLPVLVAFGVALVVFGFAEHYGGENPIRSLIPPLVTFLPGAAITTGTIELAGGQTVSGSSRLVEGIVSLLLLAVGIVAAAALIGTPPTDLIDRPLTRLGAWTPFASLVVIALGYHLHQCAIRRDVPWIFLVLVATYTGQTLGAAIFTPQLSAFFGALVMAPVVLVIGHSRYGPPTQVMFLPGFWLLVPGAAGLIGVTQIVGASSALGPASFTTTAVTVVAITLGVLLGAAIVRAGSEVRSLARSAVGPFARSAGDP
jgi:uncharacterized membrane protein YjjP (DUF1212 family)